MIDLPSQFWSARAAPIRYIVLHTTEGTDSRTWLTQTGNVSAHYLVREDVVYRLVDEENVAWHAGKVVGDPTTDLYTGVNPNEESIGIEVEGYAAQRLSEKSVSTVGALVRDIWKRRGPLPLVAHSHLSPGNRSDPGTENYARMVAAATEADVAFKDDPDAQAYIVDARNTFEAIKTVLTQLSLAQGAIQERLAALEEDAGAKHQHVVRFQAQTESQV